MNDLLTPADVEDRLRRTLAVRAGDVPPGDALPGDLSGEPDTDLALELVGIRSGTGPARRRRRLTVLAAAAACVVVAGGVAALGAGRHPTATVGPAQEGQDDQATTTAPPATLDADRQRALAEMQASLAEARAEARRVYEESLVPAEGEIAERIDELEDEAARQAMPRAVAGYRQVGQPLSQEIWLYLTWYPSPLMGQEPYPGMVGEDVTVAETRARLDTSQIDQAVNVWLLYEDGALGIHGGGLTRDEMLGVAASVHRTPGTDEFASTPPPGWEVDPGP